MSILKNVLTTIIKQVQKRNNDNPNVTTANPRVFEDVQRKLEDADNQPTTSNRADLYKDYMEKIKEAQIENEASQEVETADKSVYDDFLQEIERLKTGVEIPNAGQAPDLDFGTPQAPSTAGAVGVQAMTNSKGGSLQMRQNPSMGSPKSHIFVPDQTLLRVIEYSDNTIILDGQETRFALIDFNGQRGWVLEKYLNFN